MTTFLTVIQAEKINGEMGFKFVVTEGNQTTTESKIYARKGNAINAAKAYGEKHGIELVEEAPTTTPHIEEDEAQQEIEEIATATPTEESMEKAEAATAPKKPRKAKVSRTIDELRVKYPWAHSINTVELEDTEEMTEKIENDDVFILGAHFPEMTNRLSYWVTNQLHLGKRSFKFVTVECADCRMHRSVKPQDVFQSQRCEECRKSYKKEKRAEK